MREKKKRKYVTLKPRGKSPFELRAGKMIQPVPLWWDASSRAWWHAQHAFSATRLEVRRVLKARARMFRGRVGRAHGSFTLRFLPSGSVAFGCCTFSAQAAKKLKRWAYAKRGSA